MSLLSNDFIYVLRLAVQSAHMDSYVLYVGILRVRPFRRHSDNEPT